LQFLLDWLFARSKGPIKFLFAQRGNLLSHQFAILIVLRPLRSGQFEVNFKLLDDFG